MLITYGSVQAVTDQLLLPMAESQPELFTQNLPVDLAPLQGCLIAALWVLLTRSVGGYDPKVTRTWPDKLKPMVIAWLGTSAIMVLSFALLGLPLAAEVEFVFGIGTIIAGWRLLYSDYLPLP